MSSLKDDKKKSIKTYHASDCSKRQKKKKEKKPEKLSSFSETKKSSPGNIEYVIS